MSKLNSFEIEKLQKFEEEYLKGKDNKLYRPVVLWLCCFAFVVIAFFYLLSYYKLNSLRPFRRYSDLELVGLYLEDKLEGLNKQLLFNEMIERGLLPEIDSPDKIKDFHLHRTLKERKALINSDEVLKLQLDYLFKVREKLVNIIDFEDGNEVLGFYLYVRDGLFSFVVGKNVSSDSSNKAIATAYLNEVFDLLRYIKGFDDYSLGAREGFNLRVEFDKKLNALVPPPSLFVKDRKLRYRYKEMYNYSGEKGEQLRREHLELIEFYKYGR